MNPNIAEGDANKVWVIPSEITKALEGLGSSIHEVAGIPKETGGVRKRVDMGSTEPDRLSSDMDHELTSANKAVEDAIAEAEHAANPGHHAADVPADQPSSGDDTTEAPPTQ